MITCHVKYIIDPYQITTFERYSRQLVGLVNRPHTQVERPVLAVF
ncbi:hypothetical protein C4J85_0305 [Pseudomonas sp. R4-34-07]|nr:hypothetical protein C4J85_0305 [Pseudomonas sp. R4-34-07]